MNEGALPFLSFDIAHQVLLRIVFGLLSFFTVLFYTWKAVKPRAFLKEMIDRTHSWWAIVFLYLIFFCLHPVLGYVGMAALALGGLYELTSKIDRKTLPLTVRQLAFGMIPVQFYLSYRGDLLAVSAMIPVVFFILALLFTLALEDPRTVLTGPSTGLWTLLLTTYGLSHLALLLSLPPVEGTVGVTAGGLFAYYLFLTQFNDVLQFLWGALFGKTKISPRISPKKTWEGLIGGTLTTMFLAYLLRFLTPFDAPQSVIVGAALSLTGFLGDLTISAFKRSLNIKDMGNLIPGHGGLLDRIDSVTLSSVVFFYLIYYWYYV